MKKNGIIEFIFIMITLALMIFSKNIGIRIISGIIILTCTIISRIVVYLKAKKMISEVKKSSENYILCRENKSFLLLISFTFIFNAMSNITNIKINKNREMLSNGEEYIINFMDLINQIGIAEKVGLLIDIVLIVLAIIIILEWLASMAVISDDKIIFHQGEIFEFSEITEIKYKEPLFLKRKIMQLHTNNGEEELILKLNEFKKVKRYLESRILNIKWEDL